MALGRWIAWSLVASALTAASCRRPPAVPLDQPFDLRVGGFARIANSDLDIRFRRVASDNRCPKGVECITAGTAMVTLDGRIWKAPPETFDVPLPGNDEPGFRAFDGYKIWLLRLAPAPVAGQTADTTAYVATFKVEKR